MANFTNTTVADGFGRSFNITAHSISQAVILGICLLMILISNTFILVILKTVKNCFEDMQQFVFRALAITDFLTGVFCCGLTIMAIIFGAGQPFSSTLCAIRGIACTGLVNLSALLIACACVDRFIAVVYPLRYCTLVTMKRARIVLLVVCVVATFNGLLSLLRGRTVAKNNLCLSDFSSERFAFRPSLITSLFLSCLSLLVATVTNMKVLLVSSAQLRRSANVVPSDNTNESDFRKVASKFRRRSLKGHHVLIVATAAFFVAIIPWSIVSASQFNPKSSIATPTARFVTSLFVISKSWMNALIFVTLNKRFRRAAQRAMHGTQVHWDADTTASQTYAQMSEPTELVSNPRPSGMSGTTTTTYPLRKVSIPLFPHVSFIPNSLSRRPILGPSGRCGSITNHWFSI